MLYLPFPPTSIRKKSFCLTMSLFLSMIISYTLSVLYPFYWIWLVPLVILFTFTPSIFKPDIISIPYRAYNKLIGIFSKLAKEYILFISFIVISIAVGKKRDSFDSAAVLNSDENSLWFYKNHANIKDYSIENDDLVLEDKSKNFMTNYFQWIMNSSNWWAIILMPYLFLISIFEEKNNTHTVSGNIYTLY